MSAAKKSKTPVSTAAAAKPTVHPPVMPPEGVLPPIESVAIDPVTAVAAVPPIETPLIETLPIETSPIETPPIETPAIATSVPETQGTEVHAIESTRIESAPIEIVTPEKTVVAVPPAVLAMPAPILKGYEEMVQFGKDNFDALIQSHVAVTEGVHAVSSAVASLLHSAVEHVAAAGTSLIGAKTLTEVLDLSAVLAKTNLEHVVAESEKMTRASAKLAKEVMAPITHRVDAVVEKMTRHAA